jgi:hypothetical protein
MFCQRSARRQFSKAPVGDRHGHATISTINESLEQPAQSKVSMCIWEYASVCFSGLIEWTDFHENHFAVVNVGIPPDTRQADLQGRSETQFGNQARRYERRSPGTHKGGSKLRVSLLELFVFDCHHSVHKGPLLSVPLSRPHHQSGSA